VFDDKYIIILVLNFNKSGCPQSNKKRDIYWGRGGGKGGRCVGMTTLPPLSADCLLSLGASTLCSPQELYWPA